MSKVHLEDVNRPLIDISAGVDLISLLLGLWAKSVRVTPARAPPEPDEWVIEPCYDDPFPCLPRRSEAKTGLRHRTGYGLRERLNARDRRGPSPDAGLRLDQAIQG